jgi:flavin-dependent dehydrogenase
LSAFAATFDASAQRDIAEPRILIEATRDGWWYTMPLPKRRRAVCYMTDSDLLPKQRSQLIFFWNHAFLSTKYVAQLLPTYRKPETLTLTSASTDCAEIPFGERWLAIGDAALAFDPLSSQGLLFALHSALAAANFLIHSASVGKFTPNTYSEWIQTVFEDYIRHYEAYYKLESRWPDSPFWCRRRVVTRLRPNEQYFSQPILRQEGA